MKDLWPLDFRVGATGFFCPGFYCGIGIAYGRELSLSGVPGLGQAISTFAQGLRGADNMLGGIGRQVRHRVRSSGVKGVDCGLMCGFGVGYGLGVGFVLKPSAAQALQKSLNDARGKVISAVQSRLPTQILPQQPAGLNAANAAPGQVPGASAPPLPPAAAAALAPASAQAGMPELAAPDASRSIMALHGPEDSQAQQPAAEQLLTVDMQRSGSRLPTLGLKAFEFADTDGGQAPLKLQAPEEKTAGVRTMGITMKAQGAAQVNGDGEVHVINLGGPELLEAAQQVTQATRQLNESLQRLETAALELRDTVDSLNRNMKVR